MAAPHPTAAQPEALPFCSREGNRMPDIVAAARVLWIMNAPQLANPSTAGCLLPVLFFPLPQQIECLDWCERFDLGPGQRREQFPGGIDEQRQLDVVHLPIAF